MINTSKITKVAGVATAALTATAGIVALNTVPAYAAGDGKVISSTRLTVRNAPTTHAKAAGSIRPGAVIPLSCKTTGTSVGGNDRWYLLPGSDSPEWVSARYIRNLGTAPQWCGNDERFVGRATTSIRVRVGPNTRDASVATLPKGRGIDIICKTTSQSVDGNNRWYWTTGHRWVSARYVDNVGRSPNWCVES